MPNTRDKLITTGLINKEFFGNNLILYLPEDEAKLKDFKLTHFKRKDLEKIFEDAPKKQEAKHFCTEKHSDDIKNKVIKPWLEQLPSFKEDNMIGRFPLPVQDDVLFNDFKKHVVKEIGNPYNDLKKFISTYDKFMDVKRKFSFSLKNLIRKTLNKAPIKFNEPEDTPRQVIETECLESEYSTCIDEIYNYLRGLLIKWGKYNFDKDSFDFRLSGFHSEVEDKGNFAAYRFQGIYCGYSIRGISRDNFKNSMNSIFKELLREIKDSDYVDRMKDLMRLGRQCEDDINAMRKTLQAYIDITYLPGECPFVKVQ